MRKGNEIFEQWTPLSKGLNLPISELSKTATEICRHAVKQNIEILGENFERFSDQLKRLSTVKKPEDFINLQKECLHEDVTATVDNLEKIIHLTMGNMDEMTRLYSTTAAKVTEKAVAKAQSQAETIKTQAVKIKSSAVKTRAVKIKKHAKKAKK